MLAADKDRLIAGVKQNALQLRQKELEYFVERYTNLATQASILAGFAFDSLVELDISTAMDQALVAKGRQWIETVYYIAGSCTMAFALYTVCVASFACVYGHRLALQGPTGSVERAVAVMMKSRTAIFVSFALAILSLIVAASSMAWIKMGAAASAVTAIFGVLGVCLVCKHQHMKYTMPPRRTLFRSSNLIRAFLTCAASPIRHRYAFLIDPERMVHGDVRLQVGPTDVDIATLEAGFGGNAAVERFRCDAAGSVAPAAAPPRLGAPPSGAGVGVINGGSTRRDPLLSPVRAV